MKKLNLIIEELETLKAKDIQVYDFEKGSPFFDYFIVVTMNKRQANAAATHLKHLLGKDLRNIEGKDGGWTLIDANDTIIHIFSEEEREYYAFDKRLMGIKRIR